VRVLSSKQCRIKRLAWLTIRPPANLPECRKVALVPCPVESPPLGAQLRLRTKQSVGRGMEQAPGARASRVSSCPWSPGNASVRAPGEARFRCPSQSNGHARCKWSFRQLQLGVRAGQEDGARRRPPRSLAAVVRVRLPIGRGAAPAHFQHPGDPVLLAEEKNAVPTSFFRVMQPRR
jgi:hypothetical protein